LLEVIRDRRWKKNVAEEKFLLEVADFTGGVMEDST
jgi:hypothetical protein